MITKYSISVSPLARENRIQIFNYIAKDLASPQAARRIILDIDKCIAKLEIFPEMYKKLNISNSRFQDIRYTYVGKYNIFYHVNDSEKNVVVLAIQHSFRSIDNYFKGC